MPEPATATTTSLTWEITRASGYTTLALLVAAAILGYVVRRKAGRVPAASGTLPARGRLELHEFAAWGAIAALMVHLMSLLLDRYIGFNLADLLIPFHSAYARLGTASGVLALYALAVTVTAGLDRAAIGHPRWLRLHHFSQAVLILAVVHALLTGTDRTAVIALTLCAAAAGVALYGIYRKPPDPEFRARQGAPAATSMRR